uniref:Uncharacterized protein n=1 Tax=Schistosoma haematobium TaxID=6185 RepID=A0A095AE02_SCHHA
MKIKHFNKQFSLKSINTTGNIDRIEFTSMYSGPPFAMASRQIENGLLDCKELLDSKMFYNITNSINNNCGTTPPTTTTNNNSNNSNNNKGYLSSGSKYECYHPLISSNEEQVYNDNNNLKSLSKRKLLTKQYKTIDVLMKPSTNDELTSIKTSNKSVALIECGNYKLDTIDNVYHEPEYIQMKTKMKSIFDNLLHNRLYPCCKSNMNSNLCANLSDYIHANNRPERLGRYNRPKIIINLLNNQCSMEDIDEIIKIFYIGDEFHLATHENSLYKFKQKRLSTLWSYVMNELQGYIIEDKKRPLFLWIEKLAYLFQHLIDQHIYKKNITNITMTNTTTMTVNSTDDHRSTNVDHSDHKTFRHNKDKDIDHDNLLFKSSNNNNNNDQKKQSIIHGNSSVIYHPIQLNKTRLIQPILTNNEVYSSFISSTMKMIQPNELETTINMSYKTELEQLNDLLQLGNIAFHGLDYSYLLH